MKFRSVWNVILSICLVVTLLPIGGTVVNAETTILYSGTSGDLDWSIDSDGLLTISGEGNYKENSEDYEGAPKWCDYRSSIKTAKVNVSGITSTRMMFYMCFNLEKIDFGNFDTSAVTNMSVMFDNCRSLTELDLSGFDTSNVTDMRGMFSKCSSLKTLDVSSFNTRNVRDMGWMFCECSGLAELDLSNFDTSTVEALDWMFCECSGLAELNLSNFDTGNVTDMFKMFAGCRNLAVIKTPKNVNCSTELPEGTWKNSKGIIYTELPNGISESIELRKYTSDDLLPEETTAQQPTQKETTTSSINNKTKTSDVKTPKTSKIIKIQKHL